MAYFPFFADLNGKEGLIVGGGTVALRKVEKMLPYGVRLTVIAEDFLPELQDLPFVKCLEIPFTDAVLEGKTFVIAATNDTKMNQTVACACHERNIPVNVVDDKESSSFIFPALVRRGELSIGVSTGGASPSAAIYMKDQIEAMLPESLEEILVFLGNVRGTIRENILPEKRGIVLKAIFAASMREGRPLCEEEVNQILEDLA